MAVVPTITGLKVRFIGTAKGMSDEHVQAQDLANVTEETLRLKKVRACACGSVRVQACSASAPEFFSREEQEPPVCVCDHVSRDAHLPTSYRVIFFFRCLTLDPHPPLAPTSPPACLEYEANHNISRVICVDDVFRSSLLRKSPLTLPLPFLRPPRPSLPACLPPGIRGANAP